LVAEIFFGENQFAEINQEGDQLTVEVYPTQDGTPWSIPYSALVAALDEAKRRLTG